MRTQFVLIPVVALACLLRINAVRAQDDQAVNQAIGLVNQGDVDRALPILRDYVSKNAKDIRARGILGRVLDFDGRPDEAVSAWEAGLTNAASDFPLLMSIGEIRHRQGTDGPTISYRRGTMTASPSQNKAEEEKFKRSHLALAATAYEKALKLRPNELETAKALANIYSEQRKPDAAAEVWKSLVKLEPENGEYYLGLALAIQKAGRADEAMEHLKHAIELSPRVADAHQALAEIQKQKGQTAEAEQSQKRAEFYKRLPAFSTVDYSTENLKTLDSLDQAESVRKLVADPSDRAAEFLAILCWSHPHDQLETEAFEALEARGEKTTTLLRGLLDGAGSTCTVRCTAHILARRKVDGLYDFLVRLLPGDLRTFGMDMDIAGSLDDLGDPRAVEPLGQLLNPKQAGEPEQTDLLYDRRSARGRAAMALGAFDTPEARRTLEAGTRDPQVASYCFAALYRLTKDPKYLAALEKWVGPDGGFETYAIGNYLRKKVGTDQAKKLAQAWEQQRKAQVAANEAREKKEKESAAKANKKP